MITYMNTLSVYLSELSLLKKSFESLDHNIEGILTLEEVKYIINKSSSDQDIEIYKNIIEQELPSFK
jgi:hypothetical protein